MNLAVLFMQGVQSEKIYLKGKNQVFRKFATQCSRTGKELSKKFGVSSNLFSKWINTNVGIPLNAVINSGNFSREIDPCNYLVFSTRGGNGIRSSKIPAHLSGDLAYFVGYLMGDGCLYLKRHTISLCFGKQDQCNKIISIFREIFGISVSPNDYGSWLEIKMTCKPLHLFLHQVFEVPLGKKKGKLAVPPLIRKSSPAVKLSFVQGFFNADGCLCQTNKTYSIMFKQSSKQFLLELKEVISEFGINLGGPYFDKQNQSWILGSWKKEIINNFLKLLSRPWSSG